MRLYPSYCDIRSIRHVMTLSAGKNRFCNVIRLVVFISRRKICVSGYLPSIICSMNIRFKNLCARIVQVSCSIRICPLYHYECSVVMTLHACNIVCVVSMPNRSISVIRYPLSYIQVFASCCCCIVTGCTYRFLCNVVRRSPSMTRCTLQPSFVMNRGFPCYPVWYERRSPVFICSGFVWAMTG